MSEKKKYLFLYLKTGGGHLAPARSLLNYIEKRYPDTHKPVLIDGFEKSNKIIRYLVEDGYRQLQSKAKWFYEVLYAINKIHFYAKINCSIISVSVKDYLTEVILKEKPAKIVIFHFFLIQPVYEILHKLKLTIPALTVVTDPFTAHPMWFLKKKQNFIVFSERLKNKIEKKLPESTISVFPFILDEKYSDTLREDLILPVKLKLGFSEGKKIVLILGGGDGILHGKSVLERLLKADLDCIIAVVCGKNKSLYKTSEELKKKYNKKDFIIFGYVDFIYELLNISDVVITKCGASTMMEILLQKKIPVVNDYIWEQEKGNLEFIINNNFGVYEPEIKKLPEIISNLISDEKLCTFYKKNILSANLENGTEKVAEFIVK